MINTMINIYESLGKQKIHTGQKMKYWKMQFCSYGKWKTSFFESGWKRPWFWVSSSGALRPEHMIEGELCSVYIFFTLIGLE